MPITRSTWIDDDGSGTTGTVINNAELQKIYNNIDALVSGALAPKSILNAQVGTVNDWNPAGFTTAPMFIYWNGATNLTITGILGGVDGQTVTIKNRGSGLILIADYASGSAAANRIVTTVHSAPTPIAYEGFITLIYQTAGGGYWLMTAHDQGAWITPAFSAAHYMGIGGNAWTVSAGNIITQKYRLSGKTMTFVHSSNASSVSGGVHPAILIDRPAWGGFLPAGAFPVTYIVNDVPSGTTRPGYAATDTGQNAILLYRDTTRTGNWTANGGWTTMFLSIAFEVT